MSDAPPVKPASTLVLLRDAQIDAKGDVKDHAKDHAKDQGQGTGQPERPCAGLHDLQVLLLRRNKALAFAGGFWVFPGGTVDAADRAAAGGQADQAARFAAAREAYEEAGVRPDPQCMVPISHWTTPVGEKRRFATWFYAAAVPPGAAVRIDGSEIHDYRWLNPRQALKVHKAGALPMLPPTYITLCALARYRSTAEALAGARKSPCPRVLPLMVTLEGEGGFATLYPGDAGYESGDMRAAGGRHRSFLGEGGWQYQYENVVGAEPLYPLTAETAAD